MDFVLQLENVADEDDKSDIQRLYMKLLKIDTGDKDIESAENDVNEEIVIKDNTGLNTGI